MGDLESLLLVLGVIYLTECAVWVRRGSLAFGVWWGKAWSAWHPASPLANSQGALQLANPLPPLGTVFLSRAWPLSLSPEAVFAWSSACFSPGGRAPQSARFVRLADLRSVESDGSKVFVNGELFLRAGSSYAARHLAGLLEKVRSLPVANRADAIAVALCASFDTRRINEAVAAYRKQARMLRVLANILFAYLFVGAPLLMVRYGFGLLAIGVALGLLAQTVTLALLFRRAHRALLPDAAEERFTPFLTMLLAPPTAIRAQDLLARHLLELFHPLAVARVLIPPPEFKTFARRVLLDLRFPLLPVCPTDEPAAVETERWFRERLVGSVEKFLAEEKIPPAELTQPPTSVESDQVAYCPRCETPFVSATANCAECGGRALVLFAR